MRGHGCPQGDTFRSQFRSQLRLANRHGRPGLRGRQARSFGQGGRSAGRAPRPRTSPSAPTGRRRPSATARTCSAPSSPELASEQPDVVLVLADPMCQHLQRNHTRGDAARHRSPGTSSTSTRHHGVVQARLPRHGPSKAAPRSAQMATVQHAARQLQRRGPSATPCVSRPHEACALADYPRSS
jgi:hypothetical protein